MTKSELVSKLSESTGLSKKDSGEVLTALIAVVQQEVKNGNSVDIVGFGKFERTLQKGREGKIPGSDKTYKTEDKYIPKFKAGRSFKDFVAS
jgi:DNA-binding protein HU-beta